MEMQVEMKSKKKKEKEKSIKIIENNYLTPKNNNKENTNEK